MRKQPTAEQKARAAERRDKFRALAKLLTEMSDGERAALIDRAGSVVTIEGRPLSFHNTCMLAMQNPAVTVVGGFAQWKRAGRSVRKGERGLGIWVPVGGGKDDGSGSGVAVDADGKDSVGRVRFVMGTVFDIAQTEVSEAAAVA
jgi:hypothetical protein